MKHEEIDKQEYYRFQLVRINLLLPLEALKFKLSFKLKFTILNKIAVPFIRVQEPCILHSSYPHTSKALVQTVMYTLLFT